MALSYLHLWPGQLPPSRTSGPFRAVIVSELETAQDWRDEIAKWLVECGCLYVIAWGVECEAWHDTVDWTVLEKFEFADIPDDQFIMTTWHANEPLYEALWFAGQSAWHPDVELHNTVILHISNAASAAEMLDTYAVSQNTTPDE